MPENPADPVSYTHLDVYKRQGEINPAGIAYYNHLIDCLLKYNIKPYVTLYHWDLPYELHKKGGWLNEEIVEWFGEYAKVVAENFSDRVELSLIHI